MVPSQDDKGVTECDDTFLGEKLTDTERCMLMRCHDAAAKSSHPTNSFSCPGLISGGATECPYKTCW